MKKNKCPISFELFPPNTDAGIVKLRETCAAFSAFSPEYYSVTYGAGGANQDKTIKVVDQLMTDKKEVAPHLSCIGLKRQQIRELLHYYQQKNIRHLVAIRGDLPADHDNAGDFKYGVDLVEFIREETGDHFNIKVAAYPEFHPQTNEVATDLLHFKNKVNAGANCAITQFFFNAEAYFRFMDDCARLQINIPIIPGIMPINNYHNLQRFANMCGADIPLWLHKRMLACHDNPDAVLQLSIDVITSLCETLISNGAPGLHFYTLNQLEPTTSILRNLGY